MGCRGTPAGSGNPFLLGCAEQRVPVGFRCAWRAAPSGKTRLGSLSLGPSVSAVGPPPTARSRPNSCAGPASFFATERGMPAGVEWFPSACASEGPRFVKAYRGPHFSTRILFLFPGLWACTRRAAQSVSLRGDPTKGPGESEVPMPRCAAERPEQGTPTTPSRWVLRCNTRRRHNAATRPRSQRPSQPAPCAANAQRPTAGPGRLARSLRPGTRSRAGGGGRHPRRQSARRRGRHHWRRRSSRRAPAARDRPDA